jgi:hypothetical protein
VLLSSDHAVRTFGLLVFHQGIPSILVPLCVVLPEVGSTLNEPNDVSAKIQMVFFLCVIKLLEACELLADLVR